MTLTPYQVHPELEIPACANAQSQRPRGLSLVLEGGGEQRAADGIRHTIGPGSRVKTTVS